MIEVKTLEGIGIDSLYDPFCEAFSDYERKPERRRFEYMLQRRGYTSHLSFGAFDKDRLVSFILNGTGMYNNKLTVYDTGTGTIPQYRGQQLTTQIFNTSIPYLKLANMQQYLLEVLQQNEPALKVYRSLGFMAKRALNYYITAVDKVQIPVTKFPQHISLKRTDLYTIKQLSTVMEFAPSWQNAHDAVSRAADSVIIIGAFEEEKIIGYGILAPASGDVPQLLVDDNHRRQHIGSAILRELLNNNKSGVVEFINTDTACKSMTAFLQHCNIEQSGAQYEMTLELL